MRDFQTGSRYTPARVALSKALLQHQPVVWPVLHRHRVAWLSSAFVKALHSPHDQVTQVLDAVLPQKVMLVAQPA